MLSTNILNESRDFYVSPRVCELQEKRPLLRETERAAFAGEAEFRIMPAGVVLFQAQRFGQLIPGRWFGICKPRDASHADILFNIKSGGTMDLRSRDF